MHEEGVVKFQRTVISYEKMKNLLPKEKKRYLMITSILRDLNLLQKFLLFSRVDIKKEPVLMEADITIHFFFLKTLISKNHEMWEFLTKNKIIDERDQFTKEIKDYLRQIESFFSEKKVENLFSFIRNKFGFHYESWDDIDLLVDKAMKELPELEMWLSMEAGNDIYSSSNKIMLQVIFYEMRKLGFDGDNLILIEKLLDLTFGISRIFEEFSKSYLAEVMSENDFNFKEKVEVKAPIFSEVYLPFVVKNNANKNSRDTIPNL